MPDIEDAPRGRDGRCLCQWSGAPFPAGVATYDRGQPQEAIEAYAIDNLAVGRPRDVDVGVVRQPAFLWYGERDELVSDVHHRSGG